MKPSLRLLRNARNARFSRNKCRISKTTRTAAAVQRAQELADGGLLLKVLQRSEVLREVSLLGFLVVLSGDVETNQTSRNVSLARSCGSWLYATLHALGNKPQQPAQQARSAMLDALGNEQRPLLIGLSQFRFPVNSSQKPLS